MEAELSEGLPEGVPEGVSEGLPEACVQKGNTYFLGGDLGSLLGRVLGERWGRVLRAFGKGFDGFWEGFVRFTVIHSKM